MKVTLIICSTLFALPLFWSTGANPTQAKPSMVKPHYHRSPLRNGTASMVNGTMAAPAVYGTAPGVLLSASPMNMTMVKRNCTHGSQAPMVHAPRPLGNGASPLVRVARDLDSPLNITMDIFNVTILEAPLMNGTNETSPAVNASSPLVNETTPMTNLSSPAEKDANFLTSWISPLIRVTRGVGSYVDSHLTHGKKNCTHSPMVNSSSPMVNGTSPLVNVTSPTLNSTDPMVNMTSPLIRMTRQVASDQKAKMAKVMKLVEDFKLKDCVARVICALNCNPDGYGKDGKKVFNTMLSLQTSGSVSEVDSKYYVKAGMQGRTYRQDKACVKCDSEYPCSATSGDLIDVSSLIRMDGN
ncbi:hypothetical protein HDE_08158 [Halotydeus destructor]|nr:hypothetical protein HDE_08158 [Halotydeus destructor]